MRKLQQAMQLFIFFFTVGILYSGQAEAVLFYSEDFQGAVGSEWSNTSTDSTPLPADLSRKFLGRFANDAINLSLGSLPAHIAATLDFDLYIIQSWDGDGPEPGTPDFWTFDVVGGSSFTTTFSNFPNRTQDYPNAYAPPPSDAINPEKTGATESNTLGYPGFSDFPGGDSVYHLTFNFPHVDPTVAFNFTGSSLTSVSDESWGLDNVQLNLTQRQEPPNGAVVPEPSSLLLASLGLLAASFRRKFKTQ